MLNLQSKMFLSKKIKYLLILFILIDLGLSFNQYYNSPIDGDITSIVLPTAKYGSVLADPAGFKMISSGSSHTSPNRFFSLAFIHHYFRTVPFAVQVFMSPISSIYFSCAILKSLTQLLILFMIGLYAKGNKKINSENSLIAISLAIVFFQVGGYSATMGIIDSTVSYTVYYSLAFGLMLILLYPLVQKFHSADVTNISGSSFILNLLLAIVVPFMSNLAPLLLFALIITMIAGKIIFKPDLTTMINRVKADKKYLFALFIFCFLCLYSYFISLYDPDRNTQGLSFIEMLAKIPGGLKNIFFGKPGLWIVSLLIAINIILLKRMRTGWQGFKFLKWCLLFGIVYVIVLPLDGYYDYRPNIIRRDNFLPVILTLIILFIVTSLKLIQTMSVNSTRLKLSAAYMFAVMLLFTIADAPSLRIDNCQRASLEMLAISDKKVVLLSGKCNLASWYQTKSEKDSEVNANVFYFWRITKEPKYYYQL